MLYCCIYIYIKCIPYGWDIIFVLIDIIYSNGSNQPFNSKDYIG